MAGSRQPQNYEIFTGESQAMVVRHGFFERHDDVLEETPRAARTHGSAPDSVLRKLLGYEEAEPEHELEGLANPGVKGRGTPLHEERAALAALSPGARRKTPPGLTVPLPALLGNSSLSPGGHKDGSPLPVKYTFIHLPESEEDEFPQQRRHTWCAVRPGEDSASDGTEAGSSASGSPMPTYGMELSQMRRRSRPSRLLEFSAVEDMREAANESEESDEDADEDEDEDEAEEDENEAEDSKPLAAWIQRPRVSVTAAFPQRISSPASSKSLSSPGNTPTGVAGQFLNLPQPSCAPTAPSPCSPPLASPTPFAQHPAAAMTNPVLPRVTATTAPSQQGIWSTPVNPGMPLSLVQAMDAQVQGANSERDLEQLAQLAPMAMAQAFNSAAAAPAAAAASCPLNNPLAAWAAAASLWAAAYNPWVGAQQSPASLMGATGFPGVVAGAMHASAAQAPVAVGMEPRRRVAPAAAPTPAPVLLPVGPVSPTGSHPFHSAAAAVEQPATAKTTGVVAAPSKKSKGRSRRARLWAHIYLHMQDAPGEFDLVSRIIGRAGCNMRRIAETTGAKIRVRGRGSGHLEVDGKAEAPTPLMVAVTTDHQDNAGFKSAVQQTLDVLEAVATRFEAHCRRLRHTHEGPHYSIGLLPPSAKELWQRELKHEVAT